jgi:hypothetical protein
MTTLLNELRERHALAVHARDRVNADIAALTTQLGEANCAIWELESAVRALEGASMIAEVIAAPEATHVADEPAALTETPSEPQQEPIVQAIEEVNEAVDEIVKDAAVGWKPFWISNSTAEIAEAETNS